MKKNFLKIFVFIMIIFLTPKVFAQDFTVSTTNITSPNSGGTGKYTGTEIYNTGTSNVYNIGTRYNGRLSRIIFNLSPGGYVDDLSNFDLGKTYTLTLNMATEDWFNNFGSVSVKCDGSSGTELSNGRVNYINHKKINFSFSTGSNTCSFVYVDLKSSNISSTAFTGYTNWNLSSMVITDPTYCSGSDCYSPPSGGSSDSTNDDIINANNQNTEDIINNQTENTNNIIDNANQNTQDIIDNQNNLLGNCHKNLIVPTSNLYDTFNGYRYNVNLDEGQTYTIRSYNGNFNFKIGESRNGYGDNESYLNGSWLSQSSYTFTYHKNPNNTGNSYLMVYFDGQVGVNVSNYQIILTKGSYSGSFIDYNTEVCNSKIDDTNNAINDVNNSINNSNIDSGVGEGFFDDFTSQDFGLSQIITIPLNTIQSLTSKSCVPLSVPIPFTNSNITLPCMTEIYETKFPTIYNLWKIVSFGIVAYLIAIDIFHIVKGFKDPESDKVEVLDL